MTLAIGKMAGFATVQDAGRPGYRADGIPLCGAMDIVSLTIANACVGNPAGAAVIEWALAGGTIRFAERTVVAVTGADVGLSRNRAPIASNAAIEFAAGDELTVGRFERGAFIYVAVRGGIDVPLVLGSRATYLPSGFGGFHGRRLRTGDLLPIGVPSEKERASLAKSGTAQIQDRAAQAILVIEGPNIAAFSPEFRESFWASEFTLSQTSNRLGYRLEREARPNPENGRAASEPACMGAIQVPSGAGAIVLMADGPTVGGYPKIGVVAAVDIPILAQRTPGERVKFERIAIDEAQRLLRAQRAGMARLSHVASHD